MNERIQQLAEEAFKGLGTNPVYATAMIYASKELEKFAELIVRECAQFVEDKFDFIGEEIVVKERMLEYFGVK
jgi:hypothetical protein